MSRSIRSYKTENRIVEIKNIFSNDDKLFANYLDIEKHHSFHIKGGYLDLSHLPELKNTYITEIYMKKEYKSSIIKNHKIRNKKKNFDGVSLKGYVPS